MHRVTAKPITWGPIEPKEWKRLADVEKGVVKRSEAAKKSAATRTAKRQRQEEDVSEDNEPVADVSVYSR